MTIIIIPVEVNNCKMSPPLSLSHTRQQHTFFSVPVDAVDIIVLLWCFVLLPLLFFFLLTLTFNILPANVGYASQLEQHHNLCGNIKVSCHFFAEYSPSLSLSFQSMQPCYVIPLVTCVQPTLTRNISPVLCVWVFVRGRIIKSMLFYNQYYILLCLDGRLVDWFVGVAPSPLHFQGIFILR